LISVSVAYRLGIFGFAHNKEFMTEDGVMGNFGILDQRMALLWVSKYIHNLGGDASQVTISGCSAGGQSVMVHLTSPNSWAYYSKVASFSSPNGIPYKTLAEAENMSTQFLRNIECCKDNDAVF